MPSDAEITQEVNNLLDENIAFDDVAKQMVIKYDEDVTPLLYDIWKQKFDGEKEAAGGIDQFVHQNTDLGGAWLDFAAKQSTDVCQCGHGARMHLSGEAEYSAGMQCDVVGCACKGFQSPAAKEAENALSSPVAQRYPSKQAKGAIGCTTRAYGHATASSVEAGSERGWRDQDYGILSQADSNEKTATPRKGEDPDQMYDRTVPLQVEYETDVGPTIYPIDFNHEGPSDSERSDGIKRNDQNARPMWDGLQEGNQKASSVKTAVLDIDKATKEIQEKTNKQIQEETAENWASRAIAGYTLVLQANDMNRLAWFVEAEDFYREAVEHAASSLA